MFLAGYDVAGLFLHQVSVNLNEIDFGSRPLFFFFSLSLTLCRFGLLCLNAAPWKEDLQISFETRVSLTVTLTA